MWILVLVLSILAGFLGFASPLASLFYAIPIIRKLGLSKKHFSYYLNVVFGCGLTIFVIYAINSFLSPYLWAVIIGYFIIPFFIFIGQKGGFMMDIKDNIENELFDDNDVDEE